MSPARTGPSVSVAARRALEEARDSTTLQLLFKAARLANERAVTRVASDPRAARLRAAHTALLPHLDFEGLRLTSLASKIGTSKQAVGQLVDDLAAMGLVERVADPDDHRAKLIRFSRRGHAALLHGLGVLRELEDRLGAAVGARRMRDLHETLTLLIDALETTSSPQAPPRA